MSAAVPHCGACESALRKMRGEWVCLQPGCPLYGREQPVMSPKPAAPSRDKVQRKKGKGAR